ncbi:MAG: helix-turn-helix domain-containing protein [Pseudomonadota bacterium]
MTDKMVKSAVRVLDIFEAFEAEQRALTISELVDLLQIPQSSMSTLIKSLVARGFVEYNAETRRYRPSVRLAFVGNWVLGSTDINARLHTLAQQLHDETGETVLIGSENGLYMQYLSLVLSQHTMRLSLHPGLKRALHRSGLGIMLLSLKTEGEVGRIVRRYNSELSDPTEDRAVPSEVNTMVAQARSQGWFYSSNNVVRGYGSIATLLPLPQDQGMLAIGFGASTNHLNERVDELKDVLLRNVVRFENETNGAPNIALAMAGE